jgi:tetratricopeptide (TPR) repeat protein
LKLTPSERSFSRGLAALEEGKKLEALAFFEASIKLEESAPNVARRVRYTSYYGYCLALALGRTRDGLSICRKAAASEFFSPEILLNLARVHLLMSQRKEAWDTLMKGLSVDPDHEGLRAELRRMGVRRRPALPFLERKHPLNKVAGRISTRRKTASRK